MAESELFGHEKGAFTDAKAQKQGLVELAQGGTLFLDEVGELSGALQAKLLTFLDSGRFRRLGGAAEQTSTARVVAATNRDLEAAVRSGAFREDLFHRIHVVRIEIPPLRERPEDVPILVDHFLRRLSAEGGREVPELAPEVRQALAAHTWPGNVREVLNCCRYVVGLARGPVATEDDLPPFLRRSVAAAPRPPAPGPALPPGEGPPLRHDLPYKQARRLWLEHFESAFILRLLDAHGGNISQAARAAGIDRKSIQRLMKRNGIRSGDLDDLPDDGEDGEE
jgi:two-component system NtrC family response regulator